MPRRLILAALLALAACKMSLPGAGPTDGPPATPAANATATEAAPEISVSPLAPAGSAKSAPAAATTAPPPKPAAKAAPAVATPPAAAPAHSKPGKPQMNASAVVPTAGPEAQAAVDAAAQAAQPPPEVVKSPAQLACEKQKGVYSKVGAGNARACVRQTRDGGKLCHKKGDCEGQCLARSQTCSPITPLFGCQEILGTNGERMTQCID